ncbi:MAG: sigma-54-dependent Fis family transcriptional regulator [Flavobacteriales bacterium]|nr:sigma-54-dependent Fis family transcriptional regulator [Flavobacteriales bacterium]
MSTARILVIDDDQDICLLLSRFLIKNGYSVETAGRGNLAKELLAKERYDLVLCDHRLPDTDALQMLQHIRGMNDHTQVIIITGYSEVRLAVELMRRGAFDYIGKPLYPDELLMRVQDALAAKVESVEGPTRTDRATPTTPASSRAYVDGTGPAAQLIAKHIALVAPTDMSVLITGETGTGKEFVAKRIHQQSARAGAPFVAVDCGALPKDLAGSELFGHTKGSFTGAIADRSGSFEQAHGGTLFLDEIGNLTYENQVKLLRVLQERRIRRIGGMKDIEVDVRILVATNEDLRKAVAEGRFREDLLHRVNEFSIQLLPLRERREDIARFAQHFMELANARLGRQVKGFEESAMRRLMEHTWSGNLRELGNVIKRAVLLSTGDLISADCLPAMVLSGSPATPSSNDGATPPAKPDEGLRGVAAHAEREAILAALERNGFNKSRTADQLNIDRKTLYNKLKSYGLEV